MDCKQFEKLILDYIDGNLDKELSQICYHHLSHCPDCSELNENYKSIRSEIKRVERETPTADVLQSIREHAREQGIIKKTPFYKKWFYSPILVPAVAAAVTLVFVLNTGEDYMNRQNLADNEVRASKSQGKFDGNKIAERGLIAGDQKKKYVTKPYKDADSADESGYELEESEIYAVGKSVEEDLPEIPASPGDSMDDKQELSMSYETTERTGDTRASSPSAASQYNKDNSVYRSQLNKVTLLQYQGNCAESIEEAEKLLNYNPAPPLTIQKNAYTAQAECYEETGQYSKAIDVYRKILEIETKVNTEISSKIRELNNKIQQ